MNDTRYILCKLLKSVKKPEGTPFLLYYVIQVEDLGNLGGVIAIPGRTKPRIQIDCIDSCNLSLHRLWSGPFRLPAITPVQ